MAYGFFLVCVSVFACVPLMRRSFMIRVCVQFVCGRGERLTNVMRARPIRQSFAYDANEETTSGTARNTRTQKNISSTHTHTLHSLYLSLSVNIPCRHGNNPRIRLKRWAVRPTHPHTVRKNAVCYISVLDTYMTR